MRVETEDPLADERSRSRLDPPDRGIAVFDRKREIAVLEGAAHRLVLALRHLAEEDEALGAAADRADAGRDADRPRGQRRQDGAADLAPSGRNDPERPRRR